MAKQTGIIRLKGTLDGVNYYHSKAGGDLARTAGGGFSNEALKNSSKMVRPRENASEFGHCSRVKSSFRMSLIPFLCIRKDGQLHGRLMQLFTRLKAMDRVNIRGDRKVARGLETPMGAYLMADFVFTPECRVIEILGASESFDFNSRTLSVTNFDIKRVRFPTGSTHIALNLGFLIFDFNSMEYQLKTSAPFYIDKNYNASSFQMSVDLAQGNGMAIAVLGMRFYQEVNGTYYLLKSANAVGLEILEVRV